MPLIVPRLPLKDETAARLRTLASERGISLGEVVAEIVEEGVHDRQVEAVAGDRVTLYRILLAGEMVGLKVGGTRRSPEEWEKAGLPPDVCRELAASFEAWKRGRDDVAGGRHAASGGP